MTQVVLIIAQLENLIPLMEVLAVQLVKTALQAGSATPVKLVNIV
jgi:hypothetical protein